MFSFSQERIPKLCSFHLSTSILQDENTDVLLGFVHTLHTLDFSWSSAPSNVKVGLYCSQVGQTQVGNNNNLNMNVEDLTRAGRRLILGTEWLENQGGVRLQRVCG